MAVAKYDHNFSFKQDAASRQVNSAKVMNKEEQKSFAKSDFMQQVKQIEEICQKLNSSRDKTRGETDPSFQPKDDDFKVERVFKFDKGMNYYRTLGVTEYETQDNIRKAYRDLSLIYHPDKTTNMSEQDKAQYQKIFIQLKNAYATLADNRIRRQYDAARDKDVASAQVRKTKLKERDDQFDPRNAQAVLDRGGPRIMQSVGPQNTRDIKAKVPSAIVEVNLKARLEKFVFGGMKVATETLMVKDEMSAELGILELDEEDVEFEVTIPAGAPNPYIKEFKEKGSCHEDAPPDTLKFIVTCKEHDDVDRNENDLTLKWAVKAQAGIFLSAESASVRGRHVVLWGFNPLLEGTGTGAGEMKVKIVGEGVGDAGSLLLPVRIQGECLSSPGSLPAALQQRVDRLTKEQPPCEVELVLLGKINLETEPACTVSAYGNAAGTVFAIGLSSKTGSSGKASSEWDQLKANLLPLLQSSGFFLLFAGARAIVPRPLANTAAFPDDAYSAEAKEPDPRPVPWKMLGNEAFARGDFWHAAELYTRGVEDLPEAEKESAAAGMLFSNRSLCLLKVQESQSALEDARLAAKFCPDSKRAWSRVATAAAAVGGEECVDEALSAHARILGIELTRASVDALESLVKSSMPFNEGMATEYNIKGNTAFEKGEWAEAMAAYTVALARLDPEAAGKEILRSTLLANRAGVFLRLQKFDDACGDSMLALKVKPDSGKAFGRLGVALVAMRRYEDAYSAFAQGFLKDMENESCRKGRDMCLTLMVQGTSIRSLGRAPRRMADAERAGTSTRIFAMSDLHLDHSKRQWAWVASIDGEKFQEDVLIVAGDLATRMPSIVTGLQLLKSKFRRVFYTVGADDLRIQARDYPDSIAKLHAVLQVCDEVGIDAWPAAVSDSVFVVPLLSWYNAEFDWTDPTPDPNINTDPMCRWPMDGHGQTWKYFLKMNEQHLSSDLTKYGEEKTVITFSHFLPRQDLPFHSQTELGMKAAKFCGCTAIDSMVRLLKSRVHVFGRTHILHSEEHDDVLYVQQPLGYPTERRMIHRDDDKALMMQVHDGEGSCMIPWDPVTNEEGEQADMIF